MRFATRSAPLPFLDRHHDWMGAAPARDKPRLIITADDYGYWPSYNEGILAAIDSGGIDAVSAMTETPHCDPEPLLELGVEVGLHVDFESRWGARSGASAKTSLRVQMERFTDLFGRWPAFINGHHHCHARPELATPVFEMALQIGCPVRAVGRDHRQWLSERGIDTPDHLIGRIDPEEPAQPPEIKDLPEGVTEWFVHPGYPDPGSGSSFDEARREDLDLVTRLQLRARFDQPVWGRAVRSTFGECFARDSDSAQAASKSNRSAGPSSSRGSD